MARVNYSFYLLKIISKKWGLLGTSLISLIAIVVVYDFAFKGMINSQVAGSSYNMSALTQNPMTLVVVFVSMIPFVVYLTWIIFVETNNSTELVIFSRQVSRISMIIQRYAISIFTMFFQSLFALAMFEVQALRETSLSSTETQSWAMSMFFGYFVSSICISSIALLLTRFMKFVSLLTSIMVVSLAVPIATITLSSNRNTITHQRIIDDSENFSGINTIKPDNFEITDEYEYRSSIEKNGSRQPVTYKDVFMKFDAKMRTQKFGAKEALEKSMYQKYSKWDSWMAVSSIFNAFTKGRATVNLRDSWTEKKQITNLINFTDDNSVEVGGIRYMFTQTHRIINKTLSPAEIEDFEWVGRYETPSRSFLLNSYYQTVPTKTYREVVVPGTDSKYIFNGHGWLKLEPEIDVQEFEVEHPEDIKTNYQDMINLLKTNDVYATKYKDLPFSYQATLLMSIINAYSDITMTIEQKFDAALNLLDERTVVDNFGSFGFALAQIIDNSDKERFTPSKMYPNTERWNRLAKNSNYYSIGSLADSKFRGVISSDMTYNEQHYNEEYKPGLEISIIWLVILLLSIPLSMISYIRKDLN